MAGNPKRQLSAFRANECSFHARIEKSLTFTNETIFDELTKKPDGMIVLGDGAMECELAQALSRLGVRITIV